MNENPLYRYGWLTPLAAAPPPTDADRERWKREEAESKAWRRMLREQDGPLVAPNLDDEEDDAPAGPLPGQLALEL